MKLLVLYVLIVSSLLGSIKVGKFGIVDGDVYVLRNGNLIEAFHGLQIYEDDTIYSKSFSKSKIIFENGKIVEIDGKKTINMKKFVDENKILKLKTYKQIEEERKQKDLPEENTFQRNSKFYKQLEKRDLRELEKKIENFYIDENKNIHVHTEAKDITNVSDDESGAVNIGNVDVHPKSEIKNITIKGKSENINNMSKGQGTKSKVEIGNVHVH